MGQLLSRKFSQVLYAPQDDDSIFRGSQILIGREKDQAWGESLVFKVVGEVSGHWRNQSEMLQS